MNMEIITAASKAVLNITLATIALAAAYAVYYIRLAATKVKKQTQQIEDESARLLCSMAQIIPPHLRLRPLACASTKSGSGSSWKRRSRWAISRMITRSQDISIPACDPTKNLRHRKQQ